jgi:hypothetical protein
MTGRFARRMLFGSLLVGMLALGAWFDSWRARSGGRPIAAPLLVSLFTLAAVNELIAILATADAAVAAPLAARGVGPDPRSEDLPRVPADRAARRLVLVLLVCARWFVRTGLVLDRDLRERARRTAASTLGAGRGRARARP